MVTMGLGWPVEFRKWSSVPPPPFREQFAAVYRHCSVHATQPRPHATGVALQKYTELPLHASPVLQNWWPQLQLMHYTPPAPRATFPRLQAGNYTIQTAGADFGVPYCLLAMGTWQPEVYKGLCNSTWSTFSGDFEPYYYRCQNDGYHFLRTRATLESACSCSGIKELAAGLESHCG